MGTALASVTTVVLSLMAAAVLSLIGVVWCWHASVTTVVLSLMAAAVL